MLREHRERIGPVDLQHLMAAGMIVFSAAGLAFLIG
jgi:hypothetical protein